MYFHVSSVVWKVVLGVSRGMEFGRSLCYEVMRL